MTVTILKTPSNSVQPDISYHPDLQNYNARTKRRLQAESLAQVLPQGFPRRLESPLVWEADDFKLDEWVVVLSDSDILEVDSAIEKFKATSQPLGLISQDTFPLPTLSPKLHAQALELFNGRGFFVLRGIQVDRYSRLDSLIAYVGISAHVGDLRGRQDLSGMVLNHIKDLRATHSDQVIGTPAYTTDKQVFHTDIGDIVSLFSLEEAAEGGTSRISSSWRVYNELAETRPDLIHTLSEPWDFDGLGNDPPYLSRPLLYYTTQQKLIIGYARRHFTGFDDLPRSKGIPPITEAQAEALDALHFTAERYNLGLTFRRGDIQYINNLSIFHSRDAFKDSGTKTRHLLRLWLRNEELAWDLPSQLKPFWEKVYYDLKPEDQQIPLEPEVRLGFATFKQKK
ncbi:hypothetical protein Q9L58_010111 [Maublancomyces gigas]|uniref:TauD/TfdA-like domain-containing protein n=1 Tax=Discina gigas TaxID=1032678 RepID=A0ABR3G527_9PEZI